ncbi:MbnP family protein [Flavobacterium sp.]|uniref:MbnP family protein n=1 Tax=Flavobacterium sp. TaxID=239 RepID=UPI0039E3EBFB
MNVKATYCWGLLLLASVVFGQADSTRIGFDLKFGKQPLRLHQKYISGKDTLEIGAFRFYIGHFECQLEDGSTIKDSRDYHLLDAEKPESLQIALPLSSQKIKEVSFCIGVDSTASVSGALSGALDPANGMYWAWQSGYINLKIEGQSKSCPTRKNEFQFHIGGYLPPHYAIRQVKLPMVGQNPVIAVDLAHFFSPIALSKTNQVMVPGKNAMALADLSTEMFRTE